MKAKINLIYPKWYARTLYKAQLSPYCYLGGARAHLRTLRMVCQVHLRRKEAEGR